MPDLIETVGARLVVLGQREYVASMADASASMDKLAATGKTVVASSDQMNAATVKVQAAQKELSAAMAGAVTAQADYNAALKASALAEEEAAASGEAYAAEKRAEALAAQEAAAAIRDAALVEVKAAQESAAAAATSASEVAAAEESKAGAAAAGGAALKTAAFGVAAVAGVVTVASVKMAADFQQSTERLVTSAGEQQSQLDMVRQGILNLAGQVGYSSDELSKAMYTIESGGQHGAAGLDVLKAAAQGAKTENAQLSTVADAVTSVLQDYHLKASDAADVTSKLVAATSAGKTTFEELAGSMSAVLPVASANHVSLSDILGDLASMTVHGMSAQQAAQNLTDAIRHMAAPTMAQSKELAILGINSQDLSDKLGTAGLSGTVQMIGQRIRDQMGPEASKVVLDLGTALNGLDPRVQALASHVLDGSMTMKDYTKAAGGLPVVLAGQAKSFAALAVSTHTIGTTQLSAQNIMQSYSGAMQKAMGDATGLNVALMLTGENANTTNGAIATVAGATTEAGNNVKGWSEIQDTLNVKLSQAKDGLGALAIQIGTVLLPPLTVFVGWIATATQWLASHQAAAMVLAGVIGVILVGAIAALTVAFYGWMSSIVAVEVAGAPLIVIVLAIIAGVALLAGAAYLIISNWSSIAGFFSGIWDRVKIIFNLALAWVIQTARGAVGMFQDAWRSVTGFFSGLWSSVTGAFSAAWSGVVSVATTVADAIGTAFSVGLNAVATAATWLWVNVLQPVFNAISLIVRVVAAIIITVLVTPVVIALNLLGQFVMFLWTNAFQPALTLIGQGAMWLYNNAIKPAWDGIQNAIGAAYNWINNNVFIPIHNAVILVGVAFNLLWGTYVTPAWQGIQSAISTAWNWINANIFTPIKLGIQLVGAANSALWNNYIVPAWQGIQNAVNTAWQWINNNIFTPIKLGIQLVGVANTIFWQQIVIPAWQGVQNAINTAWQWINNNVFTPIKTGISIVGQAFTNFWNGVIVPVWQGIQNAISTAWNWIDKNVFTPFKAGVALLGTAFDNAQKMIGTVWKNIEDATKAPVKWVIDIVYTQGIKAVWDKVASFVGLGPLPDAPNFAGGGVLSGYRPGVDSVPAMLSPGEAVLVPELVAMIGPQAILAANAAASGRQGTVFSGGGIVHAAGGAAPAPVAGGSGNWFTNAVGAVGSFIGSAATGIGNIVGNIADFLSDPVGKATDWLKQVFTDLAPGANTQIAKMGFGVPEKAVDGLIQKVKDWFTAQQAAAASAGVAGPVGAAPAAAGGNVGLVQAMAAARGWTGAEWNALYAVVMRESGFNNNAQNPTSTAYGMFQFLDSTWSAYGASKTSDPTAQTTAGLNYIASRYKDPLGALAHEQQYGWYSGGGYVTPRAGGGPVSSGRPYLVGERGPELFVPDASGAITSNQDTAALAGGGGLGGTHVHVEAGAIVIYEANDPAKTYEAVKKGLADAVARR